MPPVSVYLAASPSADRPSAECLRELLDDEIEQLSAQLERAKALKAATAAPQQKAAPSQRFVELPTSYGSLYDKHAAPYGAPFYYSSHVSGVPLVASGGRYTYADARPFERAYSPGGARITERPHESRPSVVATSAQAPTASTFNSVAAPLPTLAASVAALQAPHAAPQVAATSFAVPSTLAPPAATQSTTLVLPSKAASSEAPSSGALSTGFKNGAAQAPAGPQGDPDNDPDKKKRDKEIDLSRKGQFLIDMAAFKSAKGRTRGSMKYKVERVERGSDLTIKNWINQMDTYFTIGQVPPEAFVNFMFMKIVPRRLNEIKQYQLLD